MKEKNVFERKNLIGIILAVVIGVAYGIVVNFAESESVRMISKIIFVASLAIMLVVGVYVDKKQMRKLFCGEAYEKIEMTDKYVKILLIVIMLILSFSGIVTLITAKEELILSIWGTLILFVAIINNVAYASKDIFRYNHNILYINEIEEIKMQSNKRGHHIIYISNGESHLFKIGNRYTRDKIYEIILERIQTRET